ncbi:MAG: hypothetical protein E6I89_04405 [Chloroflexi bacterium]|nr:MAG: hypothetical protein E6I89_04405 [Chloroflexota bacterium]
MNEEQDKDENATLDEGGGFDPRAAARLLEQTTRRAKRQFEFPSPLLSLIQAAALLAAYGAIWLSVRGQNPYSGPSGTALLELYAFVGVAAVAVGLDGRRARAGVSGRSSQQGWMRAIPFGAADHRRRGGGGLRSRAERLANARLRDRRGRRRRRERLRGAFRGVGGRRRVLVRLGRLLRHR